MRYVICTRRILRDGFYLFQEADIAGAGDDGTESIGDVPSLSEELAGHFLSHVFVFRLITHTWIK